MSADSPAGGAPGAGATPRTRRLRTLGRWLARGLLVAVGAYAVLVGAIAAIMLQPPEQFGRIIRHLPMPVVWGLVPGPLLWQWARGGPLETGALAPDFTLPRHDGGGQVSLASFRGERPVVLVFGSYT